MVSETKLRSVKANGRALILTIIAAMLVSLSMAISQVPARAFATENANRGGYEMRVRLDRALSIMSSRVGDRFTATVADPGPFNLARISGHIDSVTQSTLFQGATEINLSFDRIRFSDGQGYPIDAQIIRLYDVPSGQQVDAEHMVEIRGRRHPQTLKRNGIGALAGGIFAVTSGARGGDAVIRPRLARGGTTPASGGREHILDQDVEMLLRVYHN